MSQLSESKTLKLKRSAHRLVKAAPALLLFAALLAACSDAFDPFVESDRAFALHGFLDARRDTQFVRVQTITEQEEPGSTVEAVVTSTDLTTQETTVWRDSLVQLDDGTEGTVFVARFRPQPGRAYRIEAAWPEAPEAASEAVVRIPAEPQVQVAEPVVSGEFITQRLTFGSAMLPENVRVTYTVRRVEEGSEPVGFSFDYDARPADGGVGFDVFVTLSLNAQAIRATLGVSPDDSTSVALLDVRVAYALIDERRAEVTGGIGVVGAAAAFENAWTLAPEIVEVLGLVDAQDGGHSE